MRLSIPALLPVLSLFALSAPTFRAQSPITPASEADRAEARSLFAELIEIDTTDTPHGSVTAAAQAMRQRFLDAGFPASDLVLAGPNDRKMNLVVRLHAATPTAEKPILFLCHLDVVDALRSDWSMDPFKFVEKDGYFYGRGTQDMKDSDAAVIAAFLRLHREGFRPRRDMILALTADEEGGKSNGAAWLVQNRRDLVDAAFVINPDLGGVELFHGKPVLASVQTTEKLYADFHLTAVNRGGHSSRPRPDNAIYELVAALSKLESYHFPLELNPVTRTYFSALAERETPETAGELRALLATPPSAEAERKLSADPGFNSMLHTTCVATRLVAGHGNNALPQTAEANINCRILPGHTAEEIRQQLVKLFADPKLEVRYAATSGELQATAPDRKAVVPNTPDPRIFEPLTRLTQAIWPGVPITTTMSTGASDSVYFAQIGIPFFGYSAASGERGDGRAHGRDERIAVDSFWHSVDFFYAFAKELGGK